ncbi:methionyl-tRNA formyltransferase [Dysosmobacter sp. HCP28S3_G4]|uniref:methionyl-tRNA formyltransferase n=1 Tax=Dysosmobacter sp. HCP28S3_G4 TaxID=3438938 RepID=UPI003F889959
MRILFMGTPDFAAVSLERLIADGHEICGVFTQPDKPRNRNKVTFSPVKECALAHDLPVYQPVTLKDGTALETVRQLAPELIVVVAYGRILPEDLLKIPTYGSVNVHASLLPKYRGAAPINRAILDGETETGVSIMYLVKELDAGDVLRVAKTPIGPEETAPELWDRLAALGSQALSETIPTLADGTAVATPQDGTKATYAAMLSRELSPVDWTRPAHAVSCQVRGLLPWPCASTDVINGEPMKLYAVKETEETTSAAPGAIVAAGKQGIDIACGDGKLLRVTELQAQGGKRMAAGAYLLGHPIRK